MKTDSVDKNLHLIFKSKDIENILIQDEKKKDIKKAIQIC